MLVHSAYDGQLSDQPVRPDRPDNLCQAVPGDHGARGRFSERARSRGWQFWLTSHPAPVLGASAAAVLLGAAAIGLGARRPDRAQRPAVRRRRRLAPA
jgi:hypothetical protein